MTPSSRLCPICRRLEPAPAYRPFCSRRCADLDLRNWLSDRYAVPGETGLDEASEELGPPLDRDRPLR